MVLADGMVLPDYEEKVYLPNQKAVISWDGEEEVMILSTKIKTDNLANMAWVIPIPSKVKPEIEEGNVEIFYDLASLFIKRGRTLGLGIFSGLEVSDKGVEVVEFKKVDIYDITTLKATDAGALVGWLNANGYLVPENATSILQEYCDQEDFYFIANKINLANKYEDSAVGEKEQALQELKQGIATPIKITFQPSQAFYPLKISSLNDGQVLVDVYVFSNTPVKDKSGVLSVVEMTKNNSSNLKENYGLEQAYITHLTYTGDIKGLGSDSWFEGQAYSSSLDPQFVDKTSMILDIILFIITFIIIPIAVIVFAVIGFVVVVKKIIAKFRKKL